MKIYGIGIDLVVVARIQNLLNQYGDRLKKRIYSDIEIEYCDSHPHPALHYAARFAAKEAFVKALGTGFRDKISHRNIEIQNNNFGKPFFNLQGIALQQTQQLGITGHHLSLSHTDDAATAIVILETEDN